MEPSRRSILNPAGAPDRWKPRLCRRLGTRLPASPVTRTPSLMGNRENDHPVTHKLVDETVRESARRNGPEPTGSGAPELGVGKEDCKEPSDFIDGPRPHSLAQGLLNRRNTDRVRERDRAQLNPKLIPVTGRWIEGPLY
jgi:hypothetical protein